MVVVSVSLSTETNESNINKDAFALNAAYWAFQFVPSQPTQTTLLYNLHVYNDVPSLSMK